MKCYTVCDRYIRLLLVFMFSVPVSVPVLVYTIIWPVHLCVSCFLTVYKITLFYRKNQVFEFIPDRVPEFPLKKFEKVSGEAFFVDENLLVYIDSLIY